MENSNILELYSQSNYMVVNRDLAKTIGLTNSIVFGQLCSLQDSLGEWFFFTQDKLADACCISVSTAKRSIAYLLQHGYIAKERRGLPSKNYYSINKSYYEAQEETLRAFSAQLKLF